MAEYISTDPNAGLDGYLSTDPNAGEKPKAKSRLDTYLENQKKVGKALAFDLPSGVIRGIGGIGSNIIYLLDKGVTSAGNLFSDKVADTGVTGLVTGQKSTDTPEFRNAERKSKIDDFAADRGADPQSLAYKGGKIGAEIAATLPVGGLLARGATAVAPSLSRVAPGAVEAVRTAGFSTGRAVAPGALNAAKDLAIRAGGGAVTGGVSAGLIDPEQADTGAAVGAGLPVALAGAGALGNLAGRAVSGARSLAEPFYESGRQQILSRALRESAGGGQYADDAALRLAEAARPAVGPFMPGKEKSIVGELVPGSVPTAAQIAQNPGLAAMERAATATNPAVLVEHGQRIANQNQSRVNALQDIAGSDGARDFARANLSATADDLYKNAFDKGMNLSRNAATGGFTSKAEQAGIKGEITKLMKTPAMQDAVAQAKVMMQNEMKKTGDPAGSVLGLHYVKKALDDMIERAGGRNEQRILINLRDRMLTTVDRLSPEYSAARSVFRDMARPVNEMDTAAEIAKRAINPGTDRMTLHSFSRALDDKTAAKATGFNKATIEGTFSNENLNVLNAIRDDLRRADFAMNAGRGPGSNTVQNLAYTNMLSQSGVPNFIRGSGPAQVVGNLLKRSGDLAYAKANQQLSEDLARALLSPGDTAELLRKSTPAQRNAIKALLESPAMIHAYRSAPALAANR